MPRKGAFGKFSGRVKAFDLFGESTGFTMLNGEASHKTFLGAFLSLAIAVIAITYSYRRYTTMATYGDTTYQRIVSDSPYLDEATPLP